MRMAKQSSAWAVMQKRRWPLLLLLLVSVCAAFVFIVRYALDSCSTGAVSASGGFAGEETYSSGKVQSTTKITSDPLQFMRSKLVLLVSHELSLSGTFFSPRSTLLLSFRGKYQLM